ncbi:MAG TPA: hypothetical protein VL294_12155 [Pseudolysinimonas sp.]|nr:hypothetical protein [Pseudolysinimonas sp.]
MSSTYSRLVQRGLENDLRARQRRSIGAEIEARQADSPDLIRLSRLRAEASIQGSRDRTAAAMSVACPEHMADVGASCWRGVRGYCLDRLAAGLETSAVFFQLRNRAGALTVSIRERLTRSE